MTHYVAVSEAMRLAEKKTTLLREVLKRRADTAGMNEGSKTMACTELERKLIRTLVQAVDIALYGSQSTLRSDLRTMVTRMEHEASMRQGVQDYNEAMRAQAPAPIKHGLG